MKYQLVGKSDLKVSEIGFGCMSLGEDHTANTHLLHQAFEGGINFFDTADLYQKGLNETTVGLAFKGMREKVILATKVGNQWRADGSGWDWNPGKAYILKAVEQSLRRLQTDYIDLYQLHGGTIEDPFDETIEAFEQLKQQGKIRQWGLSSIRPNAIREYTRWATPASIMMQYSLLDRRPEELCLDLLDAKNISVLARGSLAQGLLAGKAPKQYLALSEDQVAQAAGAVQAMATSSRPAAAVAVGYVLHHPVVSSVVVGIRTQQQLKEALQIAEGNAITDEEAAVLKLATVKLIYENHR